MSGSSKYKVKAKKRNLQHYSALASSDSKPLIGKGKIILFLLLGTAIVSGIYIAAIQQMFSPIVHIYWIITGLLFLAFLYMSKRNEYLYTKIASCGELSEADKKEHLARTKQLKYLLLVLMPFLFTLIGDVVYLFLLKDLDLFGAIKNLM